MAVVGHRQGLLRPTCQWRSMAAVSGEMYRVHMLLGNHIRGVVLGRDLGDALPQPLGRGIYRVEALPPWLGMQRIGEVFQVHAINARPLEVQRVGAL
jgi:hypothetical protein